MPKNHQPCGGGGVCVTPRAILEEASASAMSYQARLVKG